MGYAKEPHSPVCLIQPGNRHEHPADEYASPCNPRSGAIMTVRTNADDMGSSRDPRRPPRRSELRGSDEAARSRDAGAIESDAAIEGGGPVLEAGDTSGVTRAPLDRPQEATELDHLFGRDAAADFRARWAIVQSSFVDDPQQAVRAGDELVTQVIEALNRTFAEQRTEFEKDSGSDESSTETLRLALRRYRAFFERLLTI